MQRLEHNIKAQSAMEYLMTYGWAILIIAVVLGALFQLGVFNPNTFAPKAPPGSCQVIRPYGSGNTNYISLAGTCNNQLPQYVSLFLPLTSNIAIENTAISDNLASTNKVTELVWIKPTKIPNTYPTLLSLNHAQLGLYDNGSGGFLIRPCVPSACSIADTRSIALNTWSMVGFTYDGSTTSNNLIVYINGAAGTLQNANGAIGSGAWGCIGTNLDIGGYGSTACKNEYTFYGNMANIQVYNASLSSNDILALYNEGIGGAPIDLFHLVAWWPLNGNARDYSGNNNNGVEAAITYSGTWANTYSAP